MNLFKKIKLKFKYLTKNPLDIVFFSGIIGAFSLSLSSIPSQLYFYYDQARDGYEAYGILHGDFIKILGPGTDIPNLFSGVLWYYFVAFLQLIGGNDPIAIGILLTIIIFGTLPMCWYLAYRLFNDRLIAYSTVLIYSFSVLFQLSTRWISNPVLGFIITPFLLYFLWEFLEKQRKKDVFITALLFGILIQSNLGNLIFLLLIPIYTLVFKVRVKSLNLPIFLLGLFLPLSSFLLAEIKFGGRGLISTISFFTKGQSSYVFSLQYPAEVIGKFSDLLTTSILPVHKLIAFAVIFLLIISIALSNKTRKDIGKNKKPLAFLLIWLLNIALFKLFMTAMSNSLYVVLPSVLALTILFSYLLTRVFKNKWIITLFVLTIIGSQLLINYTWISYKKNPFSSQDKTTYQIEKEIIDYTYKSSGYRPFSITTITVPLYINTTWDYLYTFYGNNKYRYAPFWAGRDQKGYLGKLDSQKDKTEYRYLIIEPQVPEKFIFDESLNEDNYSEIIEKKQIGQFTVEKRKSKNYSNR